MGLWIMLNFSEITSRSTLKYTSEKLEALRSVNDFNNAATNHTV